MTKQFETKATLSSRRSPGISRAIGGCMGAAYDARKDHVTGLTRVAAFEFALARYTAVRLRSNTFCPAIIATSMAEGAVRGNKGPSAQLKAIYPTGPFGQAEKVAAVTLWLSSPEASFVTGHAQPVDGGRLI
jgi:NAD(P)-dependent dehydrogenase (short-subunit alcohol dehydrogenase family)